MILYKNNRLFAVLLSILTIVRVESWISSWRVSNVVQQTISIHPTIINSHGSNRHSRTSRRMVGDARGEYYGESGGSYMVKEFSMYKDLQEIVQLAAQPLPERPDGIVCVCKYSSVEREDCRATEAEYERIARSNPATIFMRCFAEYENAHLLLAQAKVTVWPTFDLFYGGNRVARLEGANYPELEDLLQRYQFYNSDLDLFSERAEQKRKLKWGDGKVKDASRTPRTTNRFVPGYDWNSDRGFFDGVADKMQADFETQFENWIPPVDDNDKK